MIITLVIAVKAARPPTEEPRVPNALTELSRKPAQQSFSPAATLGAATPSSLRSQGFWDTMSHHFWDSW
jgi:hypothetical protein